MSGARQAWHLWGQTERLSVNSTGFAAGTSSPQLANVNYHRPETWSFALGGRLVGGPVSGVPATTVTVAFQLIWGVGLNKFSTQQAFAAGGANEGFARMRWDVPAGNTPGQEPGNRKFATRVLGPVLEDDVGATSRQSIEWIPAQSIVCNADVRVVSQAGAPVVLELFAFFAPRTHVRPEWWEGQFHNGEKGGS